ncbi:protein-L-isoaspartate O-methyltransferase [Candidatus Dojkabacteria bacterium]|uniref:Protein-L-isoaspartate O-methyltransferase n=1 Tax=Candidatus Dojkabacteria bacterium TaxID=2099670 RepID=A0A955RL89_9BACT|nr:protein-L-isoaspartate O-methyltransferase [Candidatus Dojkabacteria bacterium]
MSHSPYTWTREHLHDVLTSRFLHNNEYVEAFSLIDRADFVREEDKNHAYDDKKLPIGFGQHIPKPSVVAQLIEALSPKKGGYYLLIGGGSGYTASILGTIVGEEGKVLVLERVLFIVDQLRENIAQYPNLDSIVSIQFKDGKDGFVEHAPYDGILSVIGYPDIPEILIEQLKIGGTLILPDTDYTLQIITRETKDELVRDTMYTELFDKVQSGVE